MRLYNSTGAAQTGADTGLTASIHGTYESPTRAYSVTLVSGTATWHLEGRIGDDHTWTSIATGSATGGATLLSGWPEVRFRLSAASSAVIICDYNGEGHTIP